MQTHSYINNLAQIPGLCDPLSAMNLARSSSGNENKWLLKHVLDIA